MPRALKVFRTAIGFHDAYVAAPSRKAALAAWGTDKDLFARGAADVVDDPALIAAPLAHPGEVIRVLRGSPAEHVKALGTMPKKAKAPPPAPNARAAPRRARPPEPSRDEVRFAEAALAGAEQRRRERVADLSAREKALAAERKRVEREQAADIARFAKRLREAEAAYLKALAAWENSAHG